MTLAGALALGACIGVAAMLPAIGYALRGWARTRHAMRAQRLSDAEQIERQLRETILMEQIEQALAERRAKRERLQVIALRREANKRRQRVAHDPLMQAAK